MAHPSAQHQSLMFTRAPAKVQPIIWKMNVGPESAWVLCLQGFLDTQCLLKVLTGSSGCHL